MTTLPTFEVDKEGLRKVLTRRGFGWIVPELVQNAWDEDSTRVEITMKYADHKALSWLGVVTITVEDDDPHGFTNIAHAYTLYAESEKKSNAELRGRFNLGEKLVVAACERAVLSTTTGTVHFTPEGRVMDPSVRKHGSIFEGTVLMTRAEYDDAVTIARTLLPPEKIETWLNGEKLAPREPVRSWTEKLYTEVGEELRRTERVATVTLYKPNADETPHLYEMGIPVVSLPGGDRWHVDIGQKVPLNTERDNVTPAYLRDVRRSVLNHASDLLTKLDAPEAWTLDAAADEAVEPAALGTLLNLRFGEKHVAYDPSDREANKIAASEGYTVVPGGSLPKDVWKNVKTHGLIAPAGQVTPSPKPYAPGEANLRAVLAQEKWTPEIIRVANLAKIMAHRLLGATIEVEIVNDQDVRNFTATYARGVGDTGHLEFNLLTLGRKWFWRIEEQQVSLILHELGHHLEGDHLSRGYYRALTDLGARFAIHCAEQGPEWWEWATSRDDLAFGESTDQLDLAVATFEKA